MNILSSLIQPNERLQTSDINVSQGRVAIFVRCGVRCVSLLLQFNYKFTAESAGEKKFKIS